MSIQVIPGRQVTCYGESAIAIFDKTYLDQSNLLPTINIQVIKGQKIASGAVRHTTDSTNINVQLDEFEIISFFSMLNGFTKGFEVRRPVKVDDEVKHKFIRFVRQRDDSGLLKLYVNANGSVDRNSRYLAMPIPAEYIFYISNLVLQQIKVLTGDADSSSIIASLKLSHAKEVAL